MSETVRVTLRWIQIKDNKEADVGRRGRVSLPFRDHDRW